jgi:hypothetical protein
MVLLTGLQKILTGGSSYTGVVNAHSKTKLGFNGKIDLQPRKYLDSLNHYAANSIRDSRVAGEQTIHDVTSKLEVTKQIAAQQKTYFSLVEKQAAEEVNMMLAEMGHQMNQATQSQRLIQGQERILGRAADMAHNAQLSAIPLQAKYQVYSRGGNAVRRLF